MFFFHGCPGNAQKSPSVGLSPRKIGRHHEKMHLQKKKKLELRVSNQSTESEKIYESRNN